MGILDRLMASALVRRMQQEGQAMQAGRLGGGTDPTQGPGLNLGPMAGPAVAIPHALGLINEGAGQAAQGLTGEGMLALAKIMQASRAVSGPDVPTTPMSTLAEQVAAQGPAHPGRIMDLVRHSPDPVVSRGAGALELVANPLNFAEGPGAVARLPEVAALAPRAVPALEGVTRVGSVVNDAPFAPLALLNAYRQGRNLVRAQEASAAAFPALREAAANKAAQEHFAQVVAEKFTGVRPPQQSLASRYARNLLEATPPVPPRPVAGPLLPGQTGIPPTVVPPPFIGPVLPPVQGPPRPGWNRVPRTNLPHVGYRPGNVPRSQGPLGPPLPPELMPPASIPGNVPPSRGPLGPPRPPVYGPPRPGRKTVPPTDLTDAFWRPGNVPKRQGPLGPPLPPGVVPGDVQVPPEALPGPLPSGTPPADVPLPSEALSAPTGVPEAVVPPLTPVEGQPASDWGDRAGIIRQVANAPLTHLNSILADLHNALYPGQRADFAIPALTGQPKVAFRTSFLLDQPTGSKAEPYLDYLLNRVQHDPKAASRLADSNPTLADDIANLAPSDLHPTEHKALIQSLFKGVGEAAPEGKGTPTAIPAPTPEAAQAAAPGTLDDFNALLNGPWSVSQYVPEANSIARRLNVPEAQAQRWIDDAIAQGTLTRSPQGDLTFAPKVRAAAPDLTPPTPEAAPAVPETPAAPADDTLARLQESLDNAKAEVARLKAAGAAPGNATLATPLREAQGRVKGLGFQVSAAKKAAAQAGGGGPPATPAFNPGAAPITDLASGRQFIADATQHARDLTAAGTSTAELEAVKAAFQARVPDLQQPLLDLHAAYPRDPRALGTPTIPTAVADDMAAYAGQIRNFRRLLGETDAHINEQAGIDAGARMGAAFQGIRARMPASHGGTGGGGDGLGLLPGRLTETVAGGLGGAGIGTIAGATQGDTADERFRNALTGAGIGALAGGSIGSVAPELANLPAVAGSMLSPAMQARGVRAFQRGMAEARVADAPRGATGLARATAAQWRAQAVNTLKQLPQDALTRWATMWGIARREFGVDDAAIRAAQERLAVARDTGVTNLNNPVVAKLRRLGLQRLLPDATFRDVYGTDFLSSTAAQSRGAGRLGPAGQAAVGGLFSGATPLPRVNPISIGLGAAKSYWQPGIDAYVQFLNGVQHDAFRYAMANKALDRDIPAIARAYLDDLRSQGFNTAPLTAKGGFFAGADVAKVAGDAAGKQWDDLMEAVVRQHGDRIAKLAGDFRDASMLPGEAALGKVAPFMRWPLHYAPVVAEIAANHPRLAVVLGGIMADQQERGKEAGLAAYERATVPVTTETPVLGALARARLGGQAGTVRVNPLGAVLPFSGMAGGADTSGITDPQATAYERLKAAGDLVGAGPNPLIQSAAYALGQEYQPPQALSRTAGLEGLARLLPGPLGRLSMPSGGALLNTVRGVVEPTLHQAGVPTAGPTTENDPVFRRYAELVLDGTGLPLADPANRHYLTIDTPEAEALYQEAKRQALVAAAVGNAVSLTSPVAQTARGADAQAVLDARHAIPYTAEQIAGSSPAVAALMQRRLRDYQAATPELAAYQGASVPDRERILTQMHGYLTPGSPAYKLVQAQMRAAAAWQER